MAIVFCMFCMLGMLVPTAPGQAGPVRTYSLGTAGGRPLFARLYGVGRDKHGADWWYRIEPSAHGQKRRARPRTIDFLPGDGTFVLADIAGLGRKQIFLSYGPEPFSSVLVDFDGMHARQLYSQYSYHVRSAARRSASGRWQIVEHWAIRRCRLDPPYRTEDGDGKTWLVHQLVWKGTGFVSARPAPEVLASGRLLLLRYEGAQSAEVAIDGAYEVDPEGRVHLPLVGAMTVAGQTVQDVNTTLVRELGRYIKRPAFWLAITEEDEVLQLNRGRM